MPYAPCDKQELSPLVVTSQYLGFEWTDAVRRDCQCTDFPAGPVGLTSLWPGTYVVARFAETALVDVQLAM